MDSHQRTQGIASVNNLRPALLGVILAAPVALGACSTASTTTALQTPIGALFCQLETAAGPTIVALIDGAASAALPAGSPIFVMATGAAASAVQADCAAAAVNVGATAGIPVSPPAATVAVGTVAIKPAS